MSDYLPYIIFGFTTGSVYGICAMGLVLTYKTSGVFNIGHGAVCATGAYAFYSLREVHGWPWPVAALAILLVFGPVAGLILERLAVVLAPVTTASKIVATVGLLVALQGLITLIYGTNTRNFHTFLPQDEAFSISGTSVTVDQFCTFLIGVLAALGLYSFFRFTRTGVAMRAVVDDPNLLDMTGESPATIRRQAWVIGSTFAAASGVLFAASQTQLDVFILSLLVVQAFGAATIGRFQSLSVCFVGGILVGVVQKVVSKEVAPHAELQGLDLALPFLVLFVGLLVIPRRKLVEAGERVRQRRPTTRQFPRALSAGTYATALLVLVLVPHLWFVGPHLPAYNQAITQVGLFASLHLLVKTSGQISLCHFGFAAIGACTMGHLQGHGVPFGVALLLGGLTCVLPALIIAVPAIRLSGLYLALATLGFGIMLAQFFYGKSYMFGFGTLATPRPNGFSDDERFYYLLVAIALACAGTVLAVERSRLGRLLRGMSDSPVALSTLGLSVNIARVLVFCLSGFLAGISGGLLGTQFSAVSPSTFDYVNSLVVLAVLVLCGRHMLVAAFLGPALLYVLPNYLTGEKAASVQAMLFGLGAIVAAAVSQGGVDQWFAVRARRFADRRVGPAGVRVSVPRPVGAKPWRTPPPAPDRRTTPEPAYAASSSSGGRPD